MKTFRILISFLLGFVLIGCNNEDNLLTSEKKGLKSRNDFDPKNKVGYVLNEEEIKEVALAVPLEFSSFVSTKTGLVSKKVKETIPYNSTKWGKSNVITKSTSANDIYIVNYEDNAGFVVLSASDCVNRVLAYSDKGNLTEDVEVPGV
ncbi:MAG: Spi family protease inhibitor, partial [Parabacteroides sp.]|nr:Spi family protease inhibitor [Parabacteroides sp.]